MPLQIRFYLDEHIANAVAHALRSHDIDVITAAEAGMTGAADEGHLEHATRDGRVLVTQDRDFIRLHVQGIAHAGIVYAAHGKSIGGFVRDLMLVHYVFEPEQMQNHLEFI